MLSKRQFNQGFSFKFGLESGKVIFCMHVYSYINIYMVALTYTRLTQSFNQSLKDKKKRNFSLEKNTTQQKKVSLNNIKILLFFVFILFSILYCK